MAYSDFTAERAVRELGLMVRAEALFPGLKPIAPPAWLPETLRRFRQQPLVSEKSRGEIIVFPTLAAAHELSGGAFAIFSGQALLGDAARELSGACDFILARTEPVAILRAPLLTIVEAKKGEVEAGLGQCMAQLVGARMFNQREGVERPLFGVVTSGQVWQFLRLDGDLVRIDPGQILLDDLGLILAALLAATST